VCTEVIVMPHVEDKVSFPVQTAEAVSGDPAVDPAVDPKIDAYLDVIFLQYELMLLNWQAQKTYLQSLGPDYFNE
jgi:hypothetical protein